jgi:hypothetical protein
MKRTRLAVPILLVGCWLLSASLLPATAFAEQIPALRTLPSSLPPEVQTKLSRERESLAQELQVFLADAGRFNAKPAETQTDAEFAALGERRARYISKAKAFNREVAQASATAMLSNRKAGETPVVDPAVRQERDDFEKVNAAWTKRQKTLIQQQVEKTNPWCSAIYASLKTKEPPLPYKKFDELQPGDVLLISPDKGNDLDALKSKGIRFADRLSSWEWESPASHTVLFIKEVNGKKLFLDNTSGMDGKTVTGVGPHIITGEEFLKIYGTREAHIAQPVSKVEGQKLWAAARELSLKELTEEPKKSRGIVDNTNYGLYGDDNMVCSETSRWALIKAGQSIPETRSPFKKLLGVYFGPANFFSDEQHFIISPMGASRRAKD